MNAQDEMRQWCEMVIGGRGVPPRAIDLKEQAMARLALIALGLPDEIEARDDCTCAGTYCPACLVALDLRSRTEEVLGGGT